MGGSKDTQRSGSAVPDWTERSDLDLAVLCAETFGYGSRPPTVVTRPAVVSSLGAWGRC